MFSSIFLLSFSFFLSFFVHHLYVLYNAHTYTQFVCHLFHSLSPFSLDFYLFLCFTVWFVCVCVLHKAYCWLTVAAVVVFLFKRKINWIGIRMCKLTRKWAHNVRKIVSLKVQQFGNGKMYYSLFIHVSLYKVNVRYDMIWCEWICVVICIYLFVVLNTRAAVIIQLNSGK